MVGHKRGGSIPRHARRTASWHSMRCGLAIACIAMQGCSADAVRVKKPVVTASSQSVLLVPPEEAGSAGWCVNIGGCGAYVRTRPPILAETWSSEGEGSSELVHGIGLTSGAVTHVVVKGQAIPTRAESMLPDGVRAVVVEFRGKGPGNGEPFPRFWPVNRQGRIMPTRRGHQLLARGEPIRFSNGRHPAKGACSIERTPLEGLVVGGGSVVARIRVYRNLFGEAFQACASDSYVINGSHLLATLLLNAARPQSASAPLPAALPLSAHPGVFYEPDSEGGETLARRSAGAWIIVSRGGNRQQRLNLLEHLRARVDLRA